MSHRQNRSFLPISCSVEHVRLTSSWLTKDWLAKKWVSAVGQQAVQLVGAVG